MEQLTLNDELLEAALEAVKLISKQLDDAKQEHERWAAAGFIDALLRWKMKL